MYTANRYVITRYYKIYAYGNTLYYYMLLQKIKFDQKKKSEKTTYGRQKDRKRDRDRGMEPLP